MSVYYIKKHRICKLINKKLFVNFKGKIFISYIEQIQKKHRKHQALELDGNYLIYLKNKFTCEFWEYRSMFA